MSVFNAFVEFVAKIIALPLSKKNTTLSVHTPSQKPEGKMVAKTLNGIKKTVLTPLLISLVRLL